MVKTHIIEHFYKNVKIKANNYFSLPQLKIQQRAEASNKAFVSS